MHFPSLISVITFILTIAAPQVWARPNPIVALSNSGQASDAAAAGSSALSDGSQTGASVTPQQPGSQSGSGSNSTNAGAAHQPHGTPPNNANFGGSGAASGQHGGSESGTQSSRGNDAPAQASQPWNSSPNAGEAAKTLLALIEALGKKSHQ